MERRDFVLAALAAALWGFTYYYIRRGLNPEIEDPSKYAQDAIYGSIANLVAKVLFEYLKPIVTARFG